MIALVLVAALISPVDETANLIGLWDSVKTSSGGIGQTLEFRGDGTFVEAATVLVDGYYRVIGDRLVVGQQPLGADAKQSTRIKIEGDVFEGGELLLLRPNQPDVKMRAETRGDTLSLSGGGRVTDYRRDPAGPWYDREHIARQPQK